MRGAAALAALLVLAVPAAAQPTATGAADPAAAAAAGETLASAAPAGFDPAIVEACLGIRRGPVPRAGCIGIAAARCLDTLGVTAEPEAIAGCYRAEGAVWQGHLQDTLARLAETAAGSDTAEQAGPGTGRRAALEVAQAAWADWAAAECGFARRMAAGGGAEVAAEAACAMRLAAERALMLDATETVQEGP